MPSRRPTSLLIELVTILFRISRRKNIALLRFPSDYSPRLNAMMLATFDIITTESLIVADG